MIPPRFIPKGDVPSAKGFYGMAMDQLAILNRQRTLGLKDEIRRVAPFPGVEIVCISNRFGYQEVTVNVLAVPKDSVDETSRKKTSATQMDNRFFVRVGSLSDIVTDEYGHVIQDSTRYYWIDFFAHENAVPISNQIAFYSPGKTYLTNEAKDEIRYTVARTVSRETFLYVVDFPDYMFYNYIRAFDLVDGEKTARFVAGYHFLATGDSIIHAPEIPMAPGGMFDGETGGHKNPPNRFYVDTITRTMCWYHILQEWSIDQPTMTASTGSIAYEVIAVDVNSETNAWTAIQLSSFALSGEVAVDYGISGASFYTPYEPVGIVSDITNISRDNISINIPFKMFPLLVSVSISSEVTSCSRVNGLATLYAIAEGYQSYNAATVTFDSGDDEYVPYEDTHWWATYVPYDCTSNYTCPEGSGEPLEKWQEDSWYTEIYPAWSELHATLSINGIPPVKFTIMENGRDAATLTEVCSSLVHFCRAQLGGPCTNASAHSSATKNLIGHVTGRFGSSHDAKVPMQNVVMLASTTRSSLGTRILRYIAGPAYGSDITSNLESALGEWGVPDPLWHNRDTYKAVSDVPYPKAYPVEDPVNWFDLSNFPTTWPELKYDPWTVSWGSDEHIDYYDLAMVDKCYIRECLQEFTASKMASISILDDRWSVGSQGIVIVTKSSLLGESKIYHDGVDKTTAILDALVRDGLLQQGEYLFDVGLI